MKSCDVDSTLEHQKENPSNVLIPLSAQKVSCGLFGITNDHIENYQSLDERFVKNKASTYFFEAESDSMSPFISARFGAEIL